MTFPAGLYWVDTPVGRDGRVRRADLAVPREISLDLLKHRDVLARWVRDERQRAQRTTLLREVSVAGIERAEAACDLLLRDGWIERREQLEGGTWQWQSIAWRDLEGLQRLLGVSSRKEREAGRQQVLEEGAAWLRSRAGGTGGSVVDPDLLDEMTHALEQLPEDRALPLDTLRSRVALLRAIAGWHDAGLQGLRRDFALRAAGTTKSIAAADWRWLEANFDLARLGIGQFSPMLWLAGDASLRWEQRQVDAGALEFVGLPLQDVERASAFRGAICRYWLIENRASFERQARSLPDGLVLVWMPGRPSASWLRAVAHLVRLAPAPAWISADADPAGVDIACSVGTIWTERAQAWEPHRMGVAEWKATAQRWPLNDHDRALLARLLAMPALAPGLRGLCEAMSREGRKAEQEGWL